MRTIKSVVFVFLVVACARTTEAACPISVAPVMVRFINGVWNDKSGAEENFDKLEKLIRNDPRWMQVEADCVDFAYTWIEPDFRDGVGLGSALRQRLSLSVSESMRFLSGTLSVPDDLQDRILELAADVDTVTCFSSGGGEDGSGNCSKLLDDINNAPITLAIAHSQGNLYWREAYRILTNEVVPVDPRRLRTVAVGTPDHLGALGPYVNILGDPVALLSFLVPNAVNPDCVPFLLGCHNFRDSYLEASDPKGQILDRIFAELPSRLPPTPLVSLQIRNGNNQVGLAESILPNAIAVAATDLSGNPVGLFPVTFRVVSGGGCLSTSPTGTDCQFEISMVTNSTGGIFPGVAGVFWKLGALVGTQTVEVISAGIETLTFTASVTPPDSDEITYFVNRWVGNGVIRGTIQTNGKFGVVDKADILDWDLEVDADGNGPSARLLGPRSGNNSMLSFFSPALEATPNGLVFDFALQTANQVVQFITPDSQSLWQLQAGVPFSDELIRESLSPVMIQSFAARPQQKQVIATISQPTSESVISSQLFEDSWSTNNAGSMSQYMINTPLAGRLSRIRVHARWQGTQNIVAQFSCYTAPNGGGSNSCQGPVPVSRLLSGDSAGEFVEFDFSNQDWFFDPTKYYILQVHNDNNCQVAASNNCLAPVLEFSGTTQIVAPNFYFNGHGLNAPYYIIYGQ